jgi:hypothetical protein
VELTDEVAMPPLVARGDTTLPSEVRKVTIVPSATALPT